MNWTFWRVVCDSRIADSLVDIRENWTLVDLFTANAVLDQLDLAQHIANREAG